MTVPNGFDGVERRGLMFVLSSPSGAGKTTLSRLLIERMTGLKMSVSATTRPIRPGETFRYEFTLRQHGTVMYHPHHNEMLQQAMGMMEE